MRKTRAPKGTRFPNTPAGAEKAAPKAIKTKAVKTAARPTKGLPDKDTLLKFLRENGEAAKADIARAFGLKGPERRALREMLQALEAEGALGRRGRRGFAE